jgi:hypothetical protein
MDGPVALRAFFAWQAHINRSDPSARCHRPGSFCLEFLYRGWLRNRLC